MVKPPGTTPAASTVQFRCSSGDVGRIGRRDKPGGDVGMPAGTAGRGRYHLPGGRIGHQRTEHRMIELVATAHGSVGSKQRRASKGEVADRVERLVADEFVGGAQAV